MDTMLTPAVAIGAVILLASFAIWLDHRFTCPYCGAGKKDHQAWCKDARRNDHHQG